MGHILTVDRFYPYSLDTNPTLLRIPFVLLFWYFIFNMCVCVCIGNIYGLSYGHCGKSVNAIKIEDGNMFSNILILWQWTLLFIVAKNVYLIIKLY